MNFPSRCCEDGRLSQVVSQAEVYQHARRPAREYHKYRVHHAPRDADLLIVKKAVESAAIMNTGNDTDLLNLLCYHAIKALTLKESSFDQNQLQRNSPIIQKFN